MNLFNEPRNWKWMVPGAFLVVDIASFMWVTWRWAEADTPEKAEMWIWIGILVVGIGLLLFLATVMNWWLYFASNRADIIATLQNAQNSTPEVRMFEAARGMHQDAVHDLLAHRRMLWRIPYVAVGELVDWVLDDAPGVRAGFADFVLDHSTKTSVMPKSMLSDKSTQFDPTGIVQDREQYDALILLMQQKLMCTRAYGNQPPAWIAPWTPEMVRHRFGLEEGAYQAERTDNVLRAIEQAKEWKQTHEPARTHEEAAWVENSLENVAKGWDPNHPKSVLASELMSDEELFEIQNKNGKEGQG